MRRSIGMQSVILKSGTSKNSNALSDQVIPRTPVSVQSTNVYQSPFRQISIRPSMKPSHKTITSEREQQYCTYTQLTLVSPNADPTTLPPSLLAIFPCYFDSIPADELFLAEKLEKSLMKNGVGSCLCRIFLSHIKRDLTIASLFLITDFLR